MKYEHALTYLNSFVNYEKKSNYQYTQSFDLGRIEHLLLLLGSPHRRIKSILIGGTNGKGSTAAILQSILRESGRHVGLYTSPHIIDIRERIRINSTYVTKKAFSQGLERIKRVITYRRCNKACGERLTFFEILTVLAIDFFARAHVDIAIFEVGLGGRLDATNVLSPLFSIITSVSYDHEDLLGKTLNAIAREKGGIIKKKSWLISAQQKRDVQRVLVTIAKKRKTRVLFNRKDFSLSSVKQVTQGWQFNFERYRNLSLPLYGDFQLENVSLALAACKLLSARFGYTLCTSTIKNGFRKISWPGRLEIISKKPPVILDGAHNPDAIQALVSSLKRLFPNKGMIIIFAVAQDKKYETMLSLMQKLGNRIIITSSGHNRSCTISMLKKRAMRHFKEVQHARSVKDAYRYALNSSKDGSCILATGSIYLIGEIKKMLGG
ncbi:MAG: bifunctional folylpolyglutamate synthase/dihydrofolate synthase [Candidatus Omnitrophica bacterium]|nr:bifunctional folylpolyglutamate synthase/dihydrofolate synthase [Candidatus Omnitrophota bacterium]